MNLMEKLKNFVEVDMAGASLSKRKFPPNVWLGDDDGSMMIYVRCARRHLEGRWALSLDIATIQVAEELQGRGVWTEFSKKVEEYNPWDVLFVENVGSERFMEWFRRNGWTELTYGEGDGPSSFYKWSK